MGRLSKAYFMHGLPGSGKDLQLGKIQARLGGSDIVTIASVGDDLLDPEIARRPRAYAAYRQEKVGGNLLPDFVVNAVVEEWFLKEPYPHHRGVSGSGRSVDQARFVHDLSLELGYTPVYLVIDFTEETGVERVRLRGRADDAEATYRKRCRSFYEYFPPVEEYLRSRTDLFHKVDGHGTPEEVFARIEPHLHNSVLA